MRCSLGTTKFTSASTIFILNVRYKRWPVFSFRPKSISGVLRGPKAYCKTSRTLTCQELLFLATTNPNVRKSIIAWNMLLVEQFFARAANLCFVSTRELYVAATKDAAVLAGVAYSTGEKRGSFSNRLSPHCSFQGNTYLPNEFLLLNTDKSYNFLHELSKQTREFKAINLFARPIPIPFVAQSHVTVDLAQSESIYKVFLYTYLCGFLKHRQLRPPHLHAA